MRAARWVGDGLRRAVAGAAGVLPGSTREAPVPVPQVDPAASTRTTGRGAPVLATVQGPAAQPQVRHAVTGPSEAARQTHALPAASGALSADEVAALRFELEAEVARLNRELHSAGADLAGLIADSVDGSGDDDADAGAKTFEREHEMAVSANTREVLGQAEHALARIAEGSYGICEGCDHPIGKRRLQAFPRATLCIDCKQRQERR